MNRVDYLAGEVNNFGFCLAVEKLLGVEVPKRAQYIRVLIVELTRIASHLFWLGTHGHDLGAMTPLFYAFREREKIMDLCEMASGARMFPLYFRIGGLAADLPEGFLPAAWEFAKTFDKNWQDYDTLLTENIIWKERTVGVGTLSAAEALNWGWSGPMARGSGVDWDLRRDNPYSSYEEFEFKVPLGTGQGDTYSRYLVRMQEMLQSNRIVKQALEKIAKTEPGDIKCADPRVSLPPKEMVYSDIASLINHFKLIQEGITPPAGEVYQCIEAPKGEMGFYIVSDGGPQPLRVKVRTPSFVVLGSLDKLARGRLLSDLIALIGTMDIVLADVDR
jgi:NADH-quinone oxidoreductase subunit D